MNNPLEWEATYEKLLDELPVEVQPSTLLEERTVRELRRRGLLRRQRRIPAAWLTGSAAAALALFASGVAVGQWLGTRSVVVAQNNTASAAAQVQRADCCGGVCCCAVFANISSACT